MKSPIILFSVLLLPLFSKAQSPDYYRKVHEADSLYQIKAYRASGERFTEAFVAFEGKGLIDHRYNAACAWSLAGIPDSAFSQLNRLASKANYSDYNSVVSDADFKPLHKDKRWAPLVKQIQANRLSASPNLNPALVATLDSVYLDDQQGRVELEKVTKKYGETSKQAKAMWTGINRKDSLNLIKVKRILDQYGWLGPDVVTASGATTLFLVIQHSDQATQEHYLPVMREAVKQKKASPGSLALLEDRVALKQGKQQIYGSQIGFDVANKKYYVLPLTDPDRVDERRKSVGLPPLANYVGQWDIAWDVNQYKQDLPRLEQLNK